METHDCKQEHVFSRIDKKLDSIEAKLDIYLAKTIQNEVKLGFITTGFSILLVPVLVGIIIFWVTQ